MVRRCLRGQRGIALGSPHGEGCGAGLRDRVRAGAASLRLPRWGSALAAALLRSPPQGELAALLRSPPWGGSFNLRS